MALKISMRARLWGTVVMIVLLIAVAQVWIALNTNWIEGRLLAANVQLSPLERQVLADTKHLPWAVLTISTLISLFVAYLMMTNLVRPVRKLARGVARFAAGDLDHRFRIETGDEVEELAEVFNEMAERIQLKQAELEELAIRDQLTGLYNRRYMIEALDLEIARVARSGGSFAVAIMDVDHFKQYNDRQGHLAGDEALRLVAAVLHTACRRVDTLARFGGEEFVLVLPQVDLDQAREVCQRLRAAVAQAAIPGAEEQPLGAVTVSIGVAVHPYDGATADELVSRADQRLYAAKAGGRNLVAWGETPAERSRDLHPLVTVS